MSMFDDVALGLGRTSVMESALEPELANDDFDSVEPLDDSVDSMDFMMEAAFNNELNMRNLDTALMYGEYNYLRENGTEMIYEASQISNMIERAKKFVQRMWEQIQKFLRTQADRIVNKADTAFLRKYEEKAKKGKAKVKATTDLLNINKIKSTGEGIIENVAKAADKVATKAVGVVVTTNDDGTKTVQDRVKGPEYDEYETILKKEFGNKSTFSDYLDEEFKIFKTDTDTTEIVVDGKTAVTNFRAVLEAKKLLRETYDKNKKAVNSQLKGLKKLETSAKKFKIIPTDASSEIHKAVRTVNKLSSNLSQTNRVTIKYMNRCKAANKAAILGSAAAAQASGQVTGTGESAMLDFDIL